jgi:hypothetical protein
MGLTDVPGMNETLALSPASGENNAANRPFGCSSIMFGILGRQTKPDEYMMSPHRGRTIPSS